VHLHETGSGRLAIRHGEGQPAAVGDDALQRPGALLPRLFKARQQRRVEGVDAPVLGGHARHQRFEPQHARGGTAGGLRHFGNRERKLRWRIAVVHDEAGDVARLHAAAQQRFRVERAARHLHRLGRRLAAE
jgi:hypothetical protein